MDFLDTYSVKARLYPALVAMAPALSLLLMAGSWSDPGFPEVVTAMTIGVLFFAAAELARRAGKRVEARMLKATGGRHENGELTFDDTTIEQATKARYREFLAPQIGIAAPTRESEAQDPAIARRFYAACYDYLRLNTYDTEKFPGAHANVGGGYFSDLLAQRPLRWIMSKAESLGLEFRRIPEQLDDVHEATISDSHGEFIRGIYRLVSPRFFRQIGAGKVLVDGAASRNLFETIDRSVFERMQRNGSYRPQNILEWSARHGFDWEKCNTTIDADTGNPIACAF